MKVLNILSTTKLSSFGVSAYRALGIANYLRLILLLVRVGITALYDRPKAQSLLAYKMGKRNTPLPFSFYGKKYIWDIDQMDKICGETPAYGLFQELVVKNCYLKHHDFKGEHMGTVIDLGANRGLFSLIMSKFTSQVISVEAEQIFCSIIKHNMVLNGISHSYVENGYVGGEGMLKKGGQPDIALSQLIEKYNIQSIDFLKIDIEGSEFEMFRNPSWLDVTQRLSMEVHLNCGNINTITDQLKRHGFLWKIASPVHFELIPRNFNVGVFRDVLLYAVKVT